MNVPNIKISNMASPRGGREVANQFIIRAKSHDPDQVGFDLVYFQSYKSVIACKDHKGNITLDENRWNYSNTTGKYRNQFLGESIKQTEQKIKDGVYQLADLNR